MSDCIFCKIAIGESSSFRIWEDEKHIAFLSIFPNTPAVTVVIPKQHVGSYIFDAPESAMNDLVHAAKTVAKRLDERLSDVGRTAMIFEGFGVDHLHAKLFPMHGTKADVWEQRNSDIKTFSEQYGGYVSSHDGERASDEDLRKMMEILM